jgi:protocatechuate 3,4-dioxygenase beta subunit
VELLTSDSVTTATDADGNPVAPVTTDSDGHYFFDNLVPGSYTALVTLPWGWQNSQWTSLFAGNDPLLDSSAFAGLEPYGASFWNGRSDHFTVADSAVGAGGYDPVCACSRTYDATVVESDPSTKSTLWNPSVDFGLYRLGLAVGDVVWRDLDSDGVQDVGEPGVAGVTVELVDKDGNAVNDADGSPVVPTTTDSSGHYLFSNLAPGDYRVRFTLPSGNRFTTAAAGADRLLDSNAVADAVNPLLGLSPVFTLSFTAPPAEQVPNTDGTIPAQYINPSIDAGVVSAAGPVVVGVGNFVWSDLNRDGAQSRHEPGLVGVTVQLLDRNGSAAKDAGGNFVAEQTTGANGRYFFDNLLPGDYRVRFRLPVGYRFTKVAVGRDRSLDSNAVADAVNPLLGLTPVFTVAASATGQTVADSDSSTSAVFVNLTIDAGACLSEGRSREPRSRGNCREDHDWDQHGGGNKRRPVQRRRRLAAV